MTNTDTAVPRKQVILSKKSSGVAFFLLDAPGKVNLLTKGVIDEFEDALKEAATDSAIKALVVISGKPDTFVSGADLHEIMKYSDPSEGPCTFSTRAISVQSAC